MRLSAFDAFFASTPFVIAAMCSVVLCLDVHGDLETLLEEDPLLLHHAAKGAEPGCDAEQIDDGSSQVTSLPPAKEVRRVPRFSYDHPCVGSRLRRRLPTVLAGADLAQTAQKWQVT